MIGIESAAFRLGDIRGRYPQDIDEEFVAAFAHAFVGHFDLRGRIATGHDTRLSSPDLHAALNRALASIGIEVVDMGLCPTEVGYFASTCAGIDAVIVVTASHNPPSYNGLKCVLANGRPITRDQGLLAIAGLMASGYRHRSAAGAIRHEDFHSQYLTFLSHVFTRQQLAPGNIALNGLNGTAATIADSIATAFDLPVTWLRKQPGQIPVHGADPAHVSLAAEMQSFMAQGNFTLGVAWDGDCDRCVCFDAQGKMVPTYYLISLLIEKFLKASPGAAVVFDTKLCWNTLDVIKRSGGKPVPSATGHAFMKQNMHKHHAVYGGELSSHHYFGAFHGCDSGMFTWLTVLQLLAESELPIHELIEQCRSEVLATPEISLALSDNDAALVALQKKFAGNALQVDQFDGLSFSMPGDWRFSVTRSKTEPVMRLNFEARRSAETMLCDGLQVFAALEPFRIDDGDWLETFAPI